MLGIVRCITHGCFFETSSGKCGSGSLAAGTGAAGAPSCRYVGPQPSGHAGDYTGSTPSTQDTHYMWSLG
jgi:hypothetical protein